MKRFLLLAMVLAPSHAVGLGADNFPLTPDKASDGVWVRLAFEPHACRLPLCFNDIRDVDAAGVFTWHTFEERWELMQEDAAGRWTKTAKPPGFQPQVVDGPWVGGYLPSEGLGTPPAIARLENSSLTLTEFQKRPGDYNASVGAVDAQGYALAGSSLYKWTGQAWVPDVIGASQDVFSWTAVDYPFAGASAAFLGEHRGGLYVHNGSAWNLDATFPRARVLDVAARPDGGAVAVGYDFIVDGRPGNWSLHEMAAPDEAFMLRSTDGDTVVGVECRDPRLPDSPYLSCVELPRGVVFEKQDGEWVRLDFSYLGGVPGLRTVDGQYMAAFWGRSLGRSFGLFKNVEVPAWPVTYTLPQQYSVRAVDDHAGVFAGWEMVDGEKQLRIWQDTGNELELVLEDGVGMGLARRMHDVQGGVVVGDAGLVVQRGSSGAWRVIEFPFMDADLRSTNGEWIGAEGGRLFRWNEVSNAWVEVVSPTTRPILEFYASRFSTDQDLYEWTGTDWQRVFPSGEGSMLVRGLRDGFLILQDYHATGSRWLAYRPENGSYVKDGNPYQYYHGGPPSPNYPRVLDTTLQLRLGATWANWHVGGYTEDCGYLVAKVDVTVVHRNPGGPTCRAHTTPASVESEEWTWPWWIWLLLLLLLLLLLIDKRRQRKKHHGRATV